MTEAPNTNTSQNGTSTTEAQTTQALSTQVPGSTPDPSAVKSAKVVGSMKVEVENITISDPMVITSIQQAIAKTANVSGDSVQVTLSKVSGRRLGGGATIVNVAYIIKIENFAEHDIQETLTRWSNLTPEQMTQTIASELTKNGVTGSVIVREIPEPKVEYAAYEDAAVSVFQPGKFVSVLVLCLTLRPVAQ